MIGKSILRITAKLLIPAIMLFGLYVQFHGDYGPGGGSRRASFSLQPLSSTAFCSAPIVPGGPSLLASLDFFLAFGVLLYAGTGVAGMLLGGNFLDYDVLAHDPVHGQHIGILVIEFGVGATVAAAMITIYLTFAGHDRPLEDK